MCLIILYIFTETEQFQPLHGKFYPIINNAEFSELRKPVLWQLRAKSISRLQHPEEQ
jgi:hypothetical protein